MQLQNLFARLAICCDGGSDGSYIPGFFALLVLRDAKLRELEVRHDETAGYDFAEVSWARLRSI